jgi:hypothetical protein
MVKTLRELSGWGWNEMTHMVIAPSDVWDEYLKVHHYSESYMFQTYKVVLPGSSKGKALADEVVPPIIYMMILHLW